MNCFMISFRPSMAEVTTADISRIRRISGQRGHKANCFCPKGLRWIKTIQIAAENEESPPITAVILHLITIIPQTGNRNNSGHFMRTRVGSLTRIHLLRISPPTSSGSVVPLPHTSLGRVLYSLTANQNLRLSLVPVFNT